MAHPKQNIDGLKIDQSKDLMTISDHKGELN